MAGNWEYENDLRCSQTIY